MGELIQIDPAEVARVRARFAEEAGGVLALHRPRRVEPRTVDDVAHESEDWNTDKCPLCMGAGKLVDRNPNSESFGVMLPCPRCSSAAAAVAATAAERARMDEMDLLWSLARLRREDAVAKGFDAYEPHDDATHRMLEAAVEFALDPRGWLVFHGLGTGKGKPGNGCRGAGKTHLAVAVARYLLDRNVRCLYMRADWFFEYCGAVERRPGDETDWKGRQAWARALDVLILDDFNQERASDAVWNIRADVLIHRYFERMPTMLISNDHPDYWYDSSIASRVHDAGQVIEASPVDFRRMPK